MLPERLPPPAVPLPAHSPRGPSSYERNLNCPASSRTIERLRLSSVESVAAERGSAEHALAERALRAGTRPAVIEEGEYAGSGLAARLFVGVVRKTIATRCQPLALWAEAQLDGRDCHPDFYGTADALLLSADIHGRTGLDVFDLKSGTWPVEANTLQLQLYARLALIDPRLRERLAGVTRIQTTIVQPFRLPRDPAGRTTFRAAFTRDEIVANTDRYLLALDEITGSEPEALPLVAGHWCRFCPLRPLSCAEHERWQTEQRLAEIAADFTVIEEEECNAAIA